MQFISSVPGLSRLLCYRSRMSKYKLIYFDLDGGRGEPVRIAFHAAGIAFEDVRWSFDDFLEKRSELRFTCAPVMEIDGQQVSQSNAIMRYVGKLAGLYPDDPQEALYCDEAMEAVEDLLHQVVGTFGLEGEQLKAARDELVNGWMTTFLIGINDLLERGGGEYFADNRLTMADLKVYVQSKSLLNGTLDHVPTDLLTRVAPLLVTHHARIAEEPVVKAYYDSRS